MTWNELVTRVGGRRAIIGLGALYVVLAGLWGLLHLQAGWSVGSAIFEILLIAVFGVALLAGGYRLRSTGIDPAEYPRVAAWTVVGIAVLIWIAALVGLHPDVEMDREVFSGLLASGIGGLAGLLVGAKEARARSRAREAERASRELEETVEELQRTNERLEEFAGIVSHDLQNPLTVARGSIELAAREESDEHLERAERALDRMDTLTEDLLALARRGQTVDDQAPVDLADLVRACWSTLPSAQATLTIETDQRVRADESRLQELLENLLRNAVEHGGADATITVGDLEGERGFYVADDGPGIPDDRRERVFESGYTTQPEGTGLGLAIVREIATAHDWAIDVVPSDAGGARFEITGVEVVEHTASR